MVANQFAQRIDDGADMGVIAFDNVFQLAAQFRGFDFVVEAVGEQVKFGWLADDRVVGQSHQSVPQVAHRQHIEGFPQWSRTSTRIERRDQMDRIVRVVDGLAAQRIGRRPTAEEKNPGAMAT